MNLSPWILVCGFASLAVAFSARYADDDVTRDIGVASSLLFWVAMMLLILAERDRG